MDILGEIQSIKYTPLLTKKEFNEYNISELNDALKKDTAFILDVGNASKFAVSWWVSAKRTRSYPYARVYNTLAHTGKRVTIIPIFKDEGKDGDRDFLQWDTISLMSLLGINVIISYYISAVKSSKYNHKITNQRFDVEYIKSEIDKLKSYQSDPLHWNLEQADEVINLSEKALDSYMHISNLTGVNMHSKEILSQKINLLKSEKDKFMLLSRKLANEAQQRERATLQPKENINDGEKAIITISNYLGGYYYFTADEAKISDGNCLKLVEAKHSSSGNLPSFDDIKDGLIKMILFSNLKTVRIDENIYNVNPVLKLTAKKNTNLSSGKQQFMKILQEEARINGFSIDYKGGI
jgi:hypothetical protein